MISIERLKSKTKSDDTALVFLAGHGDKKPAGEKFNQFLVTYDTDPRNPRNTAIRMKDLQSFWTRFPQNDGS